MVIKRIGNLTVTMNPTATGISMIVTQRAYERPLLKTHIDSIVDAIDYFENWIS